jgi:hypothetical protein
MNCIGRGSAATRDHRFSLVTAVSAAHWTFVHLAGEAVGVQLEPHETDLVGHETDLVGIVSP